MPDPLESRIEDCLEAVVTAALSGTDPQTLTFGDDTAAKEKTVIQLRATRLEEDPVNSGIWSHGCEIIAHGTISESQIQEIESTFSHTRICSDAIRAEAVNHAFGVVTGDCVELLQGSKSGVGLDPERRFEFNLWAQDSSLLS